MNRVLSTAWPLAIAVGAAAIIAFPQAVEYFLAGVCAFFILAGVPAFYLAARRAGGRA